VVLLLPILIFLVLAVAEQSAGKADKARRTPWRSVGGKPRPLHNYFAMALWEKGRLQLVKSHQPEQGR